MTLEAASFIHPLGELQANMFPSETLATLVDAWIADGATKVTGVAASEQDTATSHWVYHRAYATVAKRIAASPSSTSFGGGSGGGVESTINWGQNKADYWEQLAKKELDSFHYYVPEVPPSNSRPLFLVY